jgi:hypothetical protein
MFKINTTSFSFPIFLFQNFLVFGVYELLGKQEEIKGKLDF